MRHASYSVLFTGLLMLAGCSSGSDDTGSEVRIKCLNGQQFCLISCDLGCTQTGCSVSEIAENQRLRFKFSDRVDPASVNSASISIRTASGVAPDGEFGGDFLVGGVEVVFIPRVSTIGGVSTFGFLRNESYIISLAGGGTASQGVRSISGDTLSQELTCTVRATLGIQDEDQAPPTVELLAPTDLSAVPLDPTIVLRFSELIDTTALQTSLSEASPIRVVLRPTLSPGECNRDNEGVALEGVPSLNTETVGDKDVTVVTFQPSVQLPGRSCVTVYVSSDLRDLSGRAGVPAQFEMFTIDAVPVPLLITESFATNSGQEVLVSGGIWNGGARPGLLGGSGRHGSFNPNLGNPAGNGIFDWILDDPLDPFVIPASQTISGQAEQIVDGKFFFTDFILPEGTTLRFRGTDPVQIYVRGKVEIRGKILVNAPDMPFFIPTTGTATGQKVSTFQARVNGLTTPLAGQPGGRGVCGGGKGGDGAVKCLNGGPITVAGVVVTDGQRGAGVRVSAGHAYAATIGNTGGRGSVLFPPAGVAQNTTMISTVYRDETSPGGAGGSFMLAGTTAALPTLVNFPGLTFAPAPAAGAPMQLMPYPAAPPPNYSSLEHFTVGGSGGGGGGSHCFGTTVANDFWLAGHGGTGGGGALAIRSGGDMVVGPSAELQAKGGAGVLINGDDPATTVQQENTRGISSPGGGGSGGSFLLQSARVMTVNGLMDTSGGAGSRTGSVNPLLLNLITQAGSGSSGFYRFEAGSAVNYAYTGTGTVVPAFNAANNIGPLLDRDTASGDVSTWRASGVFFPPTWEKYELDVDFDGNGTIDQTYSDVPGGVLADGTGPVKLELQGATINQQGTGAEEGTIKPWRNRVLTGGGDDGIDGDEVNGFRFRLTYDRAAFPNQVVRALRVFART
jgi:hypothetical protein